MILHKGKDLLDNADPLPTIPGSNHKHFKVAEATSPSQNMQQ